MNARLGGKCANGVQDSFGMKDYAKVAEGLNVAATRVDKPAHIVPAIKDAVRVTESGAPFLLEIVVKEGYDFSRYPLAGL